MMIKSITMVWMIIAIVMFGANNLYCQDDDSSRQILKQGLLGAGTGAIAAGASGGKAGQGALIGAGTGVIGSMLLDAMTAPPKSERQAAPPPAQDQYYYGDEPEYYYEDEPPQQSSSGKILKQGLLGAGTGAIAAGASGGKAGQGALIGAGTGIIGGALLDTITQPAPQQRRKVYRRPPSNTMPQAVQTEQLPDGSRKKIIKKYDANGKLVSEEETYY